MTPIQHPPHLVRHGIVPPKATCQVSATRLKLFRLCKRKWAFSEIEKRFVETEAQRVGTEVHARLERYLTTGELDLTGNIGKIVGGNLADLPEPGSCLVEFPFEFWLRPRVLEPSAETFRTIDGGLILTGAIDAVTESGVIDHKTTNDFKWALTEHSLLTDEQFVIYGFVTCFLFGKDQVTGTWRYHNKKKPSGHNVKVSSDVRRLLPLFEEAAVDFLEMEKTQRNDRLDINKDLPAAPESACRAFGGCPYLGNVCDASPYMF